VTLHFAEQAYGDVPRFHLSTKLSLCINSLEDGLTEDDSLDEDSLEDILLGRRFVGGRQFIGRRELSEDLSDDGHGRNQHHSSLLNVE
jgi:hypothetical protein